MSLSAKQRRLPAEWEPQAGVMLTWPHADSDWADTLDQVEPVFLNLAEAIARREQLLVNCADRAQIDQIRQKLLDQGVPETHLNFELIPSDDTWARDHGPLTVVDDAQLQLLDFRFNGWGNKYPAARDNAINRLLATTGRFGNHPLHSFDLVLEGGSIDSDGQGTLLTTTSCQLHPQRNPGLSREDIEGEFKLLLGVERVLWLDHGCLEGDDTDGHIDMLARFCDPQTLVYQSCDEPGYSCHDDLQSMQAQLQSLRDAQGSPYRLIALPWPQPQLDDQGQRLPASYANFLVINGAVLLPTYRDPADTVAAQQLQRCFPEREIVSVDCGPLIQQHGSLHCLTMQFPAGLVFHQATD
jgi:agmatine/peptidylarginine deiminase